MRRAVYAGLAVILAALAAAPAAFAQDSTLSTRLQQLATPELRDASRAEQAEAVSLAPNGAGSLARANGGLVVEARVSGNEDARAQALADAGARILHVSYVYDTVSAAVDESDLWAVASVPGVEYVGEAITPMTGALDDGDGHSGAINTCQTGVVSEGNTQLRAGVARTQFDVDGSGVKVGVLSDSFDTNAGTTTHAADDIATGDIPGVGNPCGRTGPVEVIADFATGNDEGRAMLQIVHDIAPGASLAFATANPTQTAFADNIRALASSGANVIADDIIYFAEPMYQDGIVAQAVNDVTAQGVTYFSMAFNNNGNGVNSFEAPTGYRDNGGTTTCPATVLAHRAAGDDSCMDFDPGPGVDNTYDFDVDGGIRLRITGSWAEPMFGVTDDFDFYVINPNTGNSVSLGAATNNITSGAPVETGFVDIVTAGSRQLVIRRYDGTGSPPIKYVSHDNGGNFVNSTQAVIAPDVQGPTIYGHNGADAAITVGAVPFNNSSTIETFSSRGPVTSVFRPLNGITPSAAFPSPLTLTKPDLSATDKGITTFFGPGNRFGGTSAATPHAAAVAALQLSANPVLTRDQIEAAQKASARPVGAFGPNAMGAGLIDAQAAIAANPTAPPTVAITNRPPASSTMTLPIFEFASAGRGVLTTCVLDAVASPCTSPFRVTTPLADGDHTFTVRATDGYGQTGEGAASFTVDTTGPIAPTFSKGPKKKSTSKKAKFVFSGEPGATFVCALDNQLFKPCTSPAKVKVKKPKPKPKKHTFAIEATDALGNAGEVAVYKWKVLKKH